MRHYNEILSGKSCSKQLYLRAWAGIISVRVHINTEQDDQCSDAYIGEGPGLAASSTY